jgi:hypothetical protein
MDPPISFWLFDSSHLFFSGLLILPTCPLWPYTWGQPWKIRFYHLKSVGGSQGLLLRLPGGTTEAENYQLNSSVLATSNKKILA